MKFALVAAAMIGSTNAWFGTGHLLVARVAFDILTKESPDQLAKAESILKQMSDYETQHLEKNHPFVECATYADAFKYHGGIYQKTWHFVDQPLLDEGGTISDFPKFVPDTHSAVEALNGLIAWMNDPSATNYPVTTTVADTKGGRSAAYGTALRLIIHYAGDIHQPLHATARVNHEYPAGDRGGNSVYLPSKEGVRNLHASWDSVEYEFSGYAKLPFSTTGWNTNGSRAAAMVSNHPVSSLNGDITDLNPQVWADSSFAISKEFVYNGVKSGQSLTSDYVSKG